MNRLALITLLVLILIALLAWFVAVPLIGHLLEAGCGSC